MPRPYTCLLLFPRTLEAAPSVRSVLDALLRHGAVFDGEAQLLLEAGDDFLEEALASAWPERLAEWPGIRSVDFSLAGGVALLSLISAPQHTELEAVELNSLSPGVPGLDERLRALTRTLHLELGAERSIGAWGLMEGRRNFWDEENDRLRRGERVGQYELDLLSTS